MHTDLLAQLEPSDYRLIGTFFATQAKYKQSALFLEEAIRLNPKDATAYSDLGAAQTNLKDYPRAKESLSNALQLDGNCAGAWFNRGILHHRERQFPEGRICMNKALEFKPPWTDVAWTGLAMSSLYAGNFELAANEYEEAVRFNPRNLGARMSLGLVQMLLQDWDNGLPNYEYRLAVHPPAWPTGEIPAWAGGRIDLTGKRLLVIAEQGAGDTFQFARYGEVLHHLFPDAEEISLYVPDTLQDILVLWPGWDNVYAPKDETIPRFDLQVAIMSLPYLLRQNGFPGFIVPPVKPAIQTRHNKKLYGVGLCWRGNPEHKNDSFRSMALSELCSVVDREQENYSFFSLQYGLTEKEVDLCMALGMQTPALDDWLITAETIAKLDLVISCDTSVAHLAASMGKATWILLPANPDWRWGASVETSTWYPSVSLFRQKQLGDWTSPIQQIRSLL